MHKAASVMLVGSIVPSTDRPLAAIVVPVDIIVSAKQVKYKETEMPLYYK